MKKIIFFLLAVFSFAILMAQEGATVEPSGNIVTRNVTVQPYDALQASGLYELVLSEGDKEAVKIEADDNLQSLFSISNNGSKLVIDMPELKNRNMNSKYKKKQTWRLKVYITYKKLKSLDLAVIGNVSSVSAIKSNIFEINSKTVGNLNLQIITNKLKVNNKGVGNITLNGTATDAIVATAAVGKFDGENLIVQTMDMDNSSIGSVDLNVEKSLKIKGSFLGKVRNKGNAKVYKTGGVEILNLY